MTQADQIRKVAEFMGYTFVAGDPDHRCDKHFYNMGDGTCDCQKSSDRFIRTGKGLIYSEGFGYTESFDSLMEVWTKLLPDLTNIINSKGSTTSEQHTGATLIEMWKSACNTGNIEAAFKTVDSAIDFVNQIKSIKQKVEAYGQSKA